MTKVLHSIVKHFDRMQTVQPFDFSKLHARPKRVSQVDKLTISQHIIRKLLLCNFLSRILLAYVTGFFLSGGGKPNYMSAFVWTIGNIMLNTGQKNQPICLEVTVRV